MLYCYNKIKRLYKSKACGTKTNPKIYKQKRIINIAKRFKKRRKRTPRTPPLSLYRLNDRFSNALKNDNYKLTLFTYFIGNR